MRIDLEFAELHAPLFFLGKNFGMKLDHHKHRDINLTYDDDHDWLVVTWQGRETWVPSTNVSNMTPKSVNAVSTVQSQQVKPWTEADKHNAQVMAEAQTRKPVTAQVTTPMAHVFEGPGKGKR